MALKVWTNLDYESPNEQPFEWSVGALDLFVLTASRAGDIEDVRHSPTFTMSLADQR
jgi:F-box protein 21